MLYRGRNGQRALNIFPATLEDVICLLGLLGIATYEQSKAVLTKITSYYFFY